MKVLHILMIKMKRYFRDAVLSPAVTNIVEIKVLVSPAVTVRSGVFQVLQQ
jgi:hypothetical protein